ncbi:asparagine synthase-related protein [Bacillus spongiae]|uniref:asparagine synthase (glutamine-hydrolyzing) n=1 Tax=Bacillus spongiae TaxID=2683610 RepID=A0ABU8HED9_9BACI
MSAITGIYHENSHLLNIEDINKMMVSLEKFPSDDIQVLKMNNLFFGCHAQWITPESVGERLPFFNQEKQLAITADAIIDNRDELFDRLQTDRAIRKGIPDSQLILLAYEKWGEECPNYLIGEYAFMIWDEREKKLFGSRDFAGSRTLYYVYSENCFAFSTTLAPLFELSFVKQQLNEEWIAEFLIIPDMFNTVDTSSTVYKHIQQVPPSHSIAFQDGRMNLKKHTPLQPKERLILQSNEEYEEAFKEIFGRSVADRLRTNRNVGAYLSGGLDSGTVVSFASKELRKENKQIHTFSYVPVKDFEDWTPRSRVADETPFIQTTVKHVGNIQDHYLDFKDRNPFTEIDTWLETVEMPYKFFNNSFWIYGIYEQAAKHDIGMLLNGARGNWTISWGSSIDYYGRLLKKLKLLTFYKEINHYARVKRMGRKQLLKMVTRSAFPIINEWLTLDNQFSFPQFINSDFAKKTNVAQKVREHGIDITGRRIPGASKAREEQFKQLFYWGNGVSDTNLSLRFSLWRRDPTNDLRIIRFCLSLPDSQFVQNGIERSLIRRSTVDYLPDEVRLNHRYRGAQGVDIVHRMMPNWSEFTSELDQLMNDTSISQFIDTKVLRKSLCNVRENPSPDLALHEDFKILMRSLILYRFLKKRT